MLIEEKQKLKELRKELRRIIKDCGGDTEICHYEIDKALIVYINDKIVKKIFDDLPKWYA